MKVEFPVSPEDVVNEENALNFLKCLDHFNKRIKEMKEKRK